MAYIILVIVVASAFFLGRNTAKKASFAEASKQELKYIIKEAHEALAERTEMRKNKILEMMMDDTDDQSELAKCRGERDPSYHIMRGSISRNDVEKLLNVSDSTAGRYLAELEKERKIIQTESQDRERRYILNVTTP